MLVFLQRRGRLVNGRPKYCSGNNLNKRKATKPRSINCDIGVGVRCREAEMYRDSIFRTLVCPVLALNCLFPAVALAADPRKSNVQGSASPQLDEESVLKGHVEAWVGTIMEETEKAEPEMKQATRVKLLKETMEKHVFSLLNNEFDDTTAREYCFAFFEDARLDRETWLGYFDAIIEDVTGGSMTQDAALERANMMLIEAELLGLAEIIDALRSRIV